MPDLDHPHLPIRDDLRAAHRDLRAHLGAPGTWWSGAERTAMVAESRRATGCGLCRRRKSALSAGAFGGLHESPGTFPEQVVDAIHRIRTDPARLSRPWFERTIAAGLSPAAYVELVGVVALAAGADAFARTLGIEPAPLPEPAPGPPSRRLPAAARAGGAWVPMIAPEDADALEHDLYEGLGLVPNIIRALSLVPDQVRALRRFMDAHYLPAQQIPDPTAHRALGRPQMELVAARVSALNQCFY
jgi:alkylhydroperoxidase family enzyme